MDYIKRVALVFMWLVLLIAVCASIAIGPILLMMYLDVPALPYGLPIAWSISALLGAALIASILQGAAA